MVAEFSVVAGGLHFAKIKNVTFICCCVLSELALSSLPGGGVMSQISLVIVGHRVTQNSSQNAPLILLLMTCIATLYMRD